MIKLIHQRKWHRLIHCLLLFAIFSSCARHEYFRFDPHPPTLRPKIFAKDILQSSNEHVGYCAFSPDGKELYYAITNKDWATSKLLRVRSSDLTKRDTLYLRDRNYEGEPFITRDGTTLYFMAVLPPSHEAPWHADQYFVIREGDGWGTPVKLDTVINSVASEWHISITDNSIMYFASERELGTSALHGDIYRAEFVTGKWTNRVKLPYPINTNFNDSDPLIAPDESFLIFHSDRPGGYGEHDLYISFNREGKWSDPQNLGAKINSPGWEMAPSLTPDGQYLLYTYRKAMVTSDPSRILWVSTRILRKFARRK
jgi:Tol biopolymer transport system component